MNSGVKRSQSVKCNNRGHQHQHQENHQCGVMSPNVDFLAELRNNRQFQRQEEKFRKWENRKSVSLEDLRTERMVMVQEKLKKEKGGSVTVLSETKSSMLAALMGRSGGRNVSRFVMFF